MTNSKKSKMRKIWIPDVPRLEAYRLAHNLPDGCAALHALLDLAEAFYASCDLPFPADSVAAPRAMPAISNPTPDDGHAPVIYPQRQE